MDDETSRPDETASQRADRNWNELMQELRVMQTGTQVLAGFLLAVVFQPRFDELDAVQHGLYTVLVVLAALATILALAPVGMHRMLFHQHRKVMLVRVANRLVKADLIVVGALTVGVVALILDLTMSRPVAVTAAVVGLLVTVALWAVLPELLRRRRG
ncbi:DUF6328 family protein [Microbacterium sp.]|jgi:hypothetical protein|uniref:DUF6328 family protein n=1 Tax=Microbacterium sp. TaxID=51671 RepID=UPI003A95CAF1